MADELFGPEDWPKDVAPLHVDEEKAVAEADEDKDEAADGTAHHSQRKRERTSEGTAMEDPTRESSDLKEARRKQAEWRQAAQDQAALAGGTLLFTRDALIRTFDPPFTRWQEGEDEVWKERALMPKERYKAARRVERRYEARQGQEEPEQDVFFVRNPELADQAEVPPEAYVPMNIVEPRGAHECRPTRDQKAREAGHEVDRGATGAASSAGDGPTFSDAQIGTVQSHRPGNAGTRPAYSGASSSGDPRWPRKTPVPFTPINNATTFTPVRVKKIGSPITDP